MTMVDWYGSGAAALILVAFVFVRRIPAYLCCAILVVVAFVVLAGRAPSAQWSDAIVIAAGLCLTAVGLLLVRAMVIRSVSLHLLARVIRQQPGSFDDEIAARLDDMRRFQLARHAAGRAALTPFGNVMATFAAVLCSAFGAMS